MFSQVMARLRAPLGDRRVALVTLALCVCSPTADTSAIVLGVLWETNVIPDVTHLSRSLEAMVGLYNESDVTISMHDVTGFSQNALLTLVCGQLTASPGAIFVATVGCVLQMSLRGVARASGAVIVATTSGCDLSAPWRAGGTYLPYPPASPGLGPVMAELLTRVQGGREVAVIYDEPTASRFDDVMGGMAEITTILQAYKVRAHQQDADVAAILDSLVTTYVTPRHVLMVCSLTCQLNVIDQVRRYDRTHRVQAQLQFGDRWVLVADRYQLNTLERALDWIDNVAVIVPLSLSYKSAESVLEEAVSLVLRSIQSVNITASRPRSPGGTCGTPLSEMAMIGDTIQWYAEQMVCDACDAYDIVTMLYTDRGRHSSLVATWSPSGLTTTAPIFPNLQFGFNGRHLVVGTNVWPPFVYENRNSTLGFEGLSIELLIELAKSANFTYKLKMPADGQWGGMTNGSWNGLVGELQRKEMDLVVTALSVQSSRQKVIDYAEPYYNEYTAVLAKLPDPKLARWKLYISPFKWQVWLLLAVSIIFAGFVIWSMTNLSPYYTSHKIKSGLTRLDNAVLYTYGALFTQGGVHLPSAQSGRFVIGFWWMFCIVIVATYSGNLIAFLTVSLPALPFDTLQAMVEQNQVKYGVMVNTALTVELQETHNPILRRIWSRIKEMAVTDPSVLGNSQQQLLDKVLAGGFAYMSDKTGFELLMGTNCQIQQMKEKFLPMPYGVAMQYGSAYKSILSHEVVKLKEGGVITKWKQKWWPSQSFCSRGMVTQAKPVSLQDVQGAYYAPGMLLAVAFLVLFIEGSTKTATIWWTRRKLTAQKRQQEGTSGTVSNGAVGSDSVSAVQDVTSPGVYQSAFPPKVTGLRDIYTSNEPMVDMYGRSTTLDGKALREPMEERHLPMVDLLGEREVVDKFGRMTTVNNKEKLDMFDRPIHRALPVDKFGRVIIKQDGSVDKWGRST